MRRALPPVLIALLAALLLGPPAHAQGACAAQEPDPVDPRERCDQPPAAGCAPSSGLRSVSVRPRGAGLRLGFRRARARRVTVDVFQHSAGRRVLGERRVAHFGARRRGVRWNGRGATDGLFSARFVMALPGGLRDVRRVALVRRDGRFARRPAFYRRASCGLLSSFKLERPAFGGRRNRSLGIAFRLSRAARVTVVVRRAGRTVRRLGTAQRGAGVTHRLRLGSERLRRGDHVVRVIVRRGTRTLRAKLTARKL